MKYFEFRFTNCLTIHFDKKQIEYLYVRWLLIICDINKHFETQNANQDL